MRAAVRREDARSVCVTGAAGALVLVIAIVMMVVAAPAHSHSRAARVGGSALTVSAISRG